MKSNNPISREKYIGRTKKLYREEEIIEEYKTYQELCKGQREGMDLMSEIESTYENIAHRTFKIRKKVDKKLSKYFNGAHPFSPKLQRARDRVELWTRHKYRKNNVMTSLKSIKRLSIRLKDYSGYYSSKQQIVNNLKKAKKSRNKIEKEAYKLRLQFRKDLKEEIASKRRVSVDILEKQEAREKKAKEVGDMSKRIRERDFRSPVLKATITDPTTNEVVFIETQRELVRAAAASNRKRQSRTQGTPFRVQPLLQEFGYCADNRNNVEAVLNGTYECPPGTDKYAIEFIKMLKMPEPIRNRKTIDLVVTPEQHKQGWKKQKS